MRNLSQPFRWHQLGTPAQGNTTHPGSGGHGWELDGGAATLIATDVASQDTFAMALVARGRGFTPQETFSYPNDFGQVSLICFYMGRIYLIDDTWDWHNNFKWVFLEGLHGMGHTDNFLFVEFCRCMTVCEKVLAKQYWSPEGVWRNLVCWNVWIWHWETTCRMVQQPNHCMPRQGKDDQKDPGEDQETWGEINQDIQEPLGEEKIQWFQGT